MTKAMHALLISIVLFFQIPNKGHTSNLGVIGEVFEISEESFLSLIYKRIEDMQKDGSLNTLNEALSRRVKAHIDRPNPINIPRATSNRTHLETLKTVLTFDVTDNEGRIIYPKGYTVFPLEKMPYYNPCWIFFNADDKASLSWAKLMSTRCLLPKVILTGGSIEDTEPLFDVPIYFDQGGVLSQKLHIQSLPAMVLRQGNGLMVKEVLVSGGAL